MSQAARPASSITYSQATKFESSRVKWYEFYGHVVCIKELADIFGVPHITVVARLKAGWPLDAAISAPSDSDWTFKTIKYFVMHEMNTTTIQKRLDAHFKANPPSIKK